MPRKTVAFLETATTSCLLVFFRSHGHHGVTQRRVKDLAHVTGFPCSACTDHQERSNLLP